MSVFMILNNICNNLNNCYEEFDDNSTFLDKA